MSVPEGWRTLSLTQIAKGGLFSDGDWIETKDQDLRGSVRLTQLADVGVGEFRDRSARFLREDQAEALRCTFLEENDILIARMPDPIGRACLSPRALGRAVTAVDVAILRVSNPNIEPRYVMWAINNPAFQESVVRLQSGTTRKRISRKNLATLAIPIPDISEQRRIVDILEDHLSRLDAAEKGLNVSISRLASYELTALSRCREGEQRPLGELTEIQGGIQKQPKRAPKRNAYPFLRVANVGKHGLELDDVHLVELFEGELDRLRLKLGDLLVVEGNGSASQIGRAALWDGSIEDCVHQNHLIRVRAKPGLTPFYLEAVWNSPQNRRDLSDLASSSSGLYTLSVSKLKTLNVPVPTLQRQQSLVAEVKNVRDRRGRLETELSSAAATSGQLRRSVLAAAFSGRLTGRSSDIEMVEEMAGV
jgi:type I restriction enzyme S subunit